MQIGYGIEPTTPIKAIVFDFGGVMTDFDLKETLKFISNELDMPIKNLKKALKEEIDDLAIGLIQEKEFWIRFAKKNGTALPDDWDNLFPAFIKETVMPRKEMYSLVKHLTEQGYQISLFSNVTEWQAKIFRDLGLYKNFSKVMLSYEMGSRKPWPSSYQKMLVQLKVLPEQCIFIDDMKENVEAAEKFGIKAILFTSINDLENHLDEFTKLEISR